MVNIKNTMQPLNVVPALGSPCIPWYILTLHTFRDKNAFHMLFCALLLRRQPGSQKPAIVRNAESSRLF